MTWRQGGREGGREGGGREEGREGGREGEVNRCNHIYSGFSPTISFIRNPAR